MESPKVEKFIEDALDYFVQKNRAQYLEILARLDVEDQIKALARIGSLSAQIRQELELALGKKEEAAVKIAAPAKEEVPQKDIDPYKYEMYGKLSSKDLSLAEFGNIIKSLIRDKGITMKDVATITGISHSHFCNIVNGRTSVSSATYNKIFEWAKKQLEQ